VRYARRLRAEELISGTSGNLSARQRGDRACLITPSGVDYDAMRPADLVLVDLEGRVISGGLKPSTDTMTHVAIYRSRPDVAAVVHTHSPFATAFAVLHLGIPALLAEAAGFLGGAVRVLEYVAPARPRLAEAVAAGLGTDRAVLLPNHGVLAVGEDLNKAFAAALLVEQSAQAACWASLLGKPVPVSQREIERLHRFLHREYGQRGRGDAVSRRRIHPQKA
jgi:L-fuculose-phosphate aldolase